MTDSELHFQGLENVKVGQLSSKNYFFNSGLYPELLYSYEKSYLFFFFPLSSGIESVIRKWTSLFGMFI